MTKIKCPRELLDDYLSFKKRLTPEFLESLNLPRINDVETRDRVTEQERNIIFAKQLVEETVEEGYYPEVMNMPSAKVPEIATFADYWRNDERTHDAVLQQVLSATGEPLKDFRVAYKPSSPLWFYLLPKHAGIALPMAWGGLNEAETYAGYMCMGRKTRNPTLKRLLLDGLAPEELAHKAFYMGVARYYLHNAPYSQKAVKAVISSLWKGVGGDILPAHVVRQMTTYMFSGNEEFFSKSVGGAFRRLPGMNSFDAPERFLRAMELTSAN